MRDITRTRLDTDQQTERSRTASSHPRIVAVEHDAAMRARLADELAARYGRDYEVFVVGSNLQACTLLQEAHAAGVALVLADRREGVPLLDATRSLQPRATRVLLLGWNEHRSAREEVSELLARRHADHYVSRPSMSGDERFHRAITEFLDEWWRLRGGQHDVVRVIGDARSARTHEILDLLERHNFPATFHPSGSDAGRAALAAADLSRTTAPVVMVEGQPPMLDPSNIAVAGALGARVQPRGGTYDVVVIGGGPAGLATAVTASSEGLRVGLVERTSMGGQAGTSSMIRNYLGFPSGISGAELAARGLDQAILFGTEMVYGGDVTGLRDEEDLRVVELADGTTLTTRAVVISTGVTYRTLGVPSLDAFPGIGVYYGSSQSEARALSGESVCVVGGGNSAGQAAIHLAQFAASVTMIVRSRSLSTSMADYLVESIRSTPNIAVRFDVEVTGGGGGTRLEWIDVRDRTTGSTTRTRAAGLFVLIGADPCTSWLPAAVTTDPWGYIATGPHCDQRPDLAGEGAPLIFETSMSGVFAVGDVRQGSVKRVASAAGEGAVCVRLIHDRLQGQGSALTMSFGSGGDGT